ncbi:ABC transporter permease [Chitinophaga nivalis]|uniref:ABC transporter permease n=1 Tax=Chitinophaga nivalis TaxID=2991709 RepID=A0ABT3IGY4_9BACT|nr:ABC transporter permease [Chitinophaga nivalis]MCW3467079.1 ABC transporter permease [Chitinophaga nivalis]MCW3483230.1 ABC transporter permease [Chitinophaga nivalis]
MMFKNYCKLTYRTLLKNKTYNFLNIFGLAIGLACAGIIFLWAEDEVTFNRTHVKKDRIYQVMANWKFDGSVRTFSSSAAPMAAAMKANLPGISQVCRTTEGTSNTLFAIGDKKVYAAGIYADPSLFDIFTLPFTAGSAATAFPQLYSVVITEKAAIKFFGTTTQVLGKTLVMDNKQPYVISGVIKDMPENSSVRFEWVAPFEIPYRRYPHAALWGSNSFNTYVELAANVDVKEINQKLYNFVQQYEPEAINHAFLYPMRDWYLRSNFEDGQPSGGRIEYVRLFSLIAWIILFIACVNFMNLATARSEQRAKEVGIRKVMGAGKGKLIVQFISESLLMSAIAAIIAVGLIYILLPGFNAMVNKHLSVGLDKPLHIICLLGIIVLCGVVAGSYPSLYLSSFHPITVLKGLKLKTGKAAFVRKGLVVAQFSISIILIICTVIIYQQIQHVKNRNLGFDKNNLIVVRAEGDIVKHFAAIKNTMLASGAIQQAALTDHVTLEDGNNTDGLSWPGKQATDKILVSQRMVSPEFIATSGMEIVAGRDFKPAAAANANDVLITESMAKLMGSGSAVDKIITVPLPDSMLYFRVAGVVKDYVYGDMFGKADPVVFYCMPEEARWLYIRLHPGMDQETALKHTGDILKQYNPAYPFSYRFVDDQFNDRFANEMLMQQLSRLFATLAIVISCLGLFGLAAYTAERRTREIGIRKVLGASVTGITRLLSADFLKLVGIATLIAFPVAWYTMDSWLDKYPYRVTIHYWVFMLAGIAAMLIALLTISFQSVKAALMNPIKSLKAE